MTENGAAPTRGRLFGLFYFTIPAASDIIMGLSMEFHRKSGTKMLQFDEYKVKLNNLAPALEELAQALDLECGERELDMGQPGQGPEGAAAHQEPPGQGGQPEPPPEPVGRPDGPVRDGQRVRGRLPAPRAGGGLCPAGGRHGDRPAGDPAHRGVRPVQRDPHHPPRRRRHRGPGLGPDALPHVHPVDRAPRLHLSDHGLSGRGRGGHQVGHHHDRASSRPPS